MDHIISFIKKKIGNSKDYIFKEMSIKNNKITIVFSEVLVNGTGLNDFVLRKLTELKSINNLVNVLPENNIKVIKKEEIFNYLNNGFVICVTKKEIIAIEIRQVLERGITTIESEITLNGPKDSFSENFNTNLGLIRRRIKSENLWWSELNIGKETSTKIGILYMNNIVDAATLDEVKKKLQNINIDGIIDTSYLKDRLEDNNDSFFPTIMSTERPDKVSMALLEGKIAIIVDTSSYVLILPNFFIDFFHTVDDYYQKGINTTFTRIIRLFSFIMAIFIPAFYIAITTYNQDSIPLSLLLLLKSQRRSVPFPSIIESLFMIISFEILKESDIRNKSGAISILGGLILGDAAVAAGIISPIMIIVIALSSIAGFVFPSNEMNNAIKIYRIIFILLSFLLGIYGMYIGLIYILYKLIALKSLNKPFLAPISPFIKEEVKDSFIKTKNIGEKLRNKLLTNNIKRGKY